LPAATATAKIRGKRQDFVVTAKRTPIRFNFVGVTNSRRAPWLGVGVIIEGQSMDHNVKAKWSATPEQESKVEEALNRREEIDYQCFLKLTQLLPFVDAREPEATMLVKEAQELIRKRDRANDDFVRAVTGGD
jgi:hypothetical protein